MTRLYVDRQNRFWLVDDVTEDVELLDDVDSFAVKNKLDLGIFYETTEQICPRGHDKVLYRIKEV